MTVDLNKVFERIDQKHLTTQINIARSEDRWQCSMKRGTGAVFAVSVKPTLIEALAACLGVETGLVGIPGQPVDDDDDDGMDLI